MIEISIDGGSIATGMTADAINPAESPVPGSRVLISATALGIRRMALLRQSAICNVPAGMVASLSHATSGAWRIIV
ncbi:MULTISPECIES: hypothetical protein [Sphingobium]|uniref:hypothetical protein n=1 Tax=Sphingobium TaxID=165695 RepID=UPI002101C93D|nr:hypothetical protein [Sphingobium sp. 15-1]